MRLFNKENKNKETHRLPMGQKSKRALAVYSALVFLLCCCTTTAFAASDPLTVINNLSDFIFGLIRAIGMILLGFGIVQVACRSSPTTQPASQRLSHSAAAYHHFK